VPGGLAASRGPTVEEKKKSATIGLELAARPEALRYFFWMSIRYLALIIHLLRLLMGAYVGTISNRRTVHRQLPEETHGWTKRNGLAVLCTIHQPKRYSLRGLWPPFGDSGISRGMGARRAAADGNPAE